MKLLITNDQTDHSASIGKLANPIYII